MKKKLLRYCFAAMASRIKEIDGEFINDPREMSQNANTKKCKTRKKRFLKWQKRKEKPVLPSSDRASANLVEETSNEQTYHQH